MVQRHDLGRRYWLATVAQPVSAPAGWRTGLWLAIGLCSLQAARFAVRERSVIAPSTQVRLAYPGPLRLGLWSPLPAIHRGRFVGTSACVRLVLFATEGSCVDRWLHA